MEAKNLIKKLNKLNASYRIKDTNIRGYGKGY